MHMLKKIIVINISALLLLSNSCTKSMEVVLEPLKIPDSCEPSRRDYKTPRKQKDSSLPGKPSFNVALQGSHAHTADDVYPKKSRHTVGILQNPKELRHTIDVCLQKPDITGTYGIKPESSTRRNVKKVSFSAPEKTTPVQDILKQKFNITQTSVEAQRAYENYLKALEERNLYDAQTQAATFITTLPVTSAGQENIALSIASDLYLLMRNAGDTEKEQDEQKKSLKNDIITQAKHIQEEARFDAIVYRSSDTEEAYNKYIQTQYLPQTYETSKKSAIALISSSNLTQEEQQYIARRIADTLAKVKHVPQEDIFTELLNKASKKREKIINLESREALNKVITNNKSTYDSFLKCKTEAYAIKLLSEPSLTENEQKHIAIWATSQLNPSLDEHSKKMAAGNLFFKVLEIKQALEKIKDNPAYQQLLQFNLKTYAIKLLSEPSLTKSEQRRIALWATSQLNPSLDKSSTEIVVSYLLRKSQQSSIDNNPGEAMPTEFLKELKSNSQKIMKQINLVCNGDKSFDNIRTYSGLQDLASHLKKIFNSSAFYKELGYMEKLQYHGELLGELKKMIPSLSREFVIDIITKHLSSEEFAREVIDKQIEKLQKKQNHH